MNKLTGLEKWSYAIGNIPYAVKDTAFGTFVVFYYTQVLGLSGTLAGLAMLIALSWDAISDPIVGSWSDSIRSRWGRRHPLMLAGSIPTALLFLALFRPPGDLSETGIFLWLVGVSVLLRTFLTLYFIPYQAMGAELSADYDERTVIAKARVTVAWLGGLALPAIAFTLIFKSDGGVDGRLIADNYWIYGCLSTVMAAVTACICLWGTRHSISRLPVPSANQKTAINLKTVLDDFLAATRNINFRRTIGTKLAFGVCAGTYATLGLYMGTYFWEFSSDQLAGLMVPSLFGALTAFFLLNRLGQRFDKPRLISAVCLCFSVNVIWFVGGRLLGILPENGHPILYPLQLLQTYFSVFLIVCLQVLGVSLLADILDEQEMHTGIRQEGVFFAASAFVLKASSGMGNLAGGIVIDLANLKVGAEPGTVAEPVLFSLGLCAGPGIALGALVAWWYARQVQLSRQQHQAIRQQLADQDPASDHGGVQPL